MFAIIPDIGKQGGIDLPKFALRCEHAEGG
jgi:hypothetical protein